VGAHLVNELLVRDLVRAAAAHHHAVVAQLRVGVHGQEDGLEALQAVDLARRADALDDAVLAVLLSALHQLGNNVVRRVVGAQLVGHEGHAGAFLREAFLADNLQQVAFKREGMPSQ
jgi:hypothetical protein